MNTTTGTAVTGREIISLWGPAALRERNERTRRHQAAQAPKREQWIRRNRYYYKQVERLLRHIIEPGRTLLHVGCETGHLISALEPSVATGVDPCPEMLAIARGKSGRYRFVEAFAEDFVPGETYDYILLSNVGSIADVQRALQRLTPACERHTRLVIHNYNHLWEPIWGIGHAVGWKPKAPDHNWLAEADLQGVLELSGFEWLKTYRTALLPKNIPLLAPFANRVLAKLPLLNRLAMVEVLVARRKPAAVDPASVKVSVIVPCKDERGNIADAVERTPEMGRCTELIFCDDKSTDGTADEVHRMQKVYPERDIRLVNGPGICKSQNVWTGFENATGDILVIMDADLTVMPEELPYFVDAITLRGIEFVNGSRLIYPVPKAAMKGANMVGNKLFSSVFSYLLGQRIKDTLCGTKVLWRSDWERIRPMNGTWGTMDRWGDYDLLFGAAKLNLRILDQPVHYQERIYGITKMTKVFKNGLIMLRMCLHGFRRLKLDY
jgi:SAM-dependent methyltransferase